MGSSCQSQHRSHEGFSIPYYEVYSSRLLVLEVQAVSVSAKLTRREAELLDRLTREYGFISKSEAIRSAVRLYLNLLELRSKDRLRMLQLINELIAPSSRISSDLVEEGHREEDEI
jgi:Arc/MetJ-type ribon-helix-helix transcriptional regulator